MFTNINKKKIVFCFFVLTVESVTYYITPLLVSLLLQGEISFDRIYLFLKIFVVQLLLQTFARMLYKRYMIYFVDELGFTISQNIMEKINTSHFQTLQQYGSGYLNSIIERYQNSIKNVVVSIFFCWPDVIAAIGIFIYSTMKQSIWIGTLTIVCILVAIVLYRMVQRIQEKYIKIVNQKFSTFTNIFVDYIMNVKTIRLLGLKQYAKFHLEETSKDALKSNVKTCSIEAWKSLIIAIAPMIPVIVGISYSIHLITIGQNAIGILIFYVMSYNDFRSVLRALGEMTIVGSQYRVAKKQLMECIKEKDRLPEVEKFEMLQIIQGVYSHPNSSVRIHIPDFCVEKGQKIAIIGKSGQGKTTLFSILAGINLLKQGSYIINQSKDLNLLFGYVSQETDLFNHTIRENILLGKDVEEQKILELLESVGLLSWYQKLEKGLDTVVGEKGLKLSSGQKQRLNLVRAILLDRDIYLLDEPTSHLDGHTEQEVIHTIQKYLGNKTLIIVTHRDGLLGFCDTIYEFQDHILKKIS